MTQCPRCGQPQQREHTGVCVRCGQFLPAVQWVAAPPDGYPGLAPRARRRPYTGPPSYPVPPRWGFPLVTWRRPTSLEPEPIGASQRARTLASAAQPLLWLAAALCALTAVAEGWRYALLLQSRTDALPAGRLRVSDALVVTGGVVSLGTCALAALVVLLWVVRAYAAAAELAGVVPARRPRDLVLGWVLPGVNLLVPGSTLAEIEHAVLHRPAAERPSPSRLVRAWWLAWVVGAALTLLTLLWSFRTSTQALADGVLLHALTDLVAAAVAVLTALVVRSLTTLLRPASARARRMVVLRVRPDGGTSSAGVPAGGASAGGAGRVAGASGGDGQRGEAADDELAPARGLAGRS